jgi:hypothetical protein
MKRSLLTKREREQSEAFLSVLQETRKISAVFSLSGVTSRYSGRRRTRSSVSFVIFWNKGF